VQDEIYVQEFKPDGVTENATEESSDFGDKPDEAF